MSNHRPASPVDEDLQRLYNEVWAGFAAEEAAQSNEKDLENIYNVYSSENTGRTPSPGPVGHAQQQYNSFYPSAVQAQLPPIPPKSPKSPRRALPPLPGSPGASKTTFSMPEPEPYQPSSTSTRPNPYGVETYANYSATSNDLLRKATTASAKKAQARRFQHQAAQEDPGSSAGYVPSYEDAPPSDPYSPYQTPSASTAAIPAIEQSEYQPNHYESYKSEPSNGFQYNQSQGGDLTRQSSHASLKSSKYSYQAPIPNELPDQKPPLTSKWQEDDQPFSDPTSVYRRPTDVLRTMADFQHHQPTDQFEFADEVDDIWDEEEEDPSRFINFSLLSHIAVQLRDKIPKGTHVKGSIPYHNAFTGKDAVSTIQSLIQRELAINHGVSTSDRRVAIQVARSLQSQLFFYEVEWGGHVLQDGVEDVYMLLDDQDGIGGEELPTGVITMLTRCYSPSCGDGVSCYAFDCPRKGRFPLDPLLAVENATPVAKRESWKESIDPAVLQNLPKSEIQRQSIIHNIIVREEQYIQDLDTVETAFMKPLRRSGSTIMPQNLMEDFVDDVFSNILDLRECNKRLLEALYVRQREQSPVIQKVGDIFLEAATEFRHAYPAYTGHHPTAEKRLKEETEKNYELKLFLEQCSRDCAKSRADDAPRFDLKHFLNRPSEHLQKYLSLVEAVLKETTEENPDADFLREAISALQSLQSAAQLRSFQSAMGKGPTAKWEWHDMVSTELRISLPKKEAKRQSIIFELIKGEMAYVKDLENIEIMYIQPLRAAIPPIIGGGGEKDKLERFIDDVFHNYYELLEHHKRLVEAFHEIQKEQHPVIKSITAPMMDAALNFREAYMEYIPNYPIAAYRIDDEMANNLAFRSFVEQQTRHQDAHRLDMKNFINRPIPRLLRYELLLKGIMDETVGEHEDLVNIPNVIEVIKALGKETEPGVASAKQKVELWRYNANLVFSKQGEIVDMDLLNPDRNLIHSGKLLRQPETGLEWNWSELFVLLFDNYLVMTKVKGDRDGAIVKYTVNRRPVPLDLLNLVSFNDPPTQRAAGLLGGLQVGRPKHGETPVANPQISPETDARAVYPLTLHHNGRMGGTYVLFAESAQIRTEWKEKLEHAIGLRKVVQESNKAFEVETLSSDTFLMPLYANTAQGPAWEQGNTFTGKVTCSVPFTTPDGRHLVAVGCQEGVWIGYRHDPRSMRRVLQLKAVTQCAMLESFGIFLVLADKSLFAYHIEALVPSSPHSNHTNLIPQKLNGTKDVHFFSVGMLQNRTLVAYMKKKGLDSIFRVLEPVSDKINEKVKAPAGLGSRLGFRSAKSDWFRIYRDFFLPSESFDLIFLKARIAILCAKGFEIMDLNDFNSVTIPTLDDPRHAYLAKRCDGCKPMGMFRSDEDQFLLCYDEFGLHVDKHGDPIRPGVVIEWEGTAERVACHPPYVLLFDSRFIEIRYIDTGRLAQIIPGNDIRCIWDGRGVSNPALQRQPVDPREQQEAKVHAVMTNQDGASRSKAVAQCVFELVPTVPLMPPPGQMSPVRQQHQQRAQEFNPYQQQHTHHHHQHSPQQSMHQGQGYSHPSVGDAPPVGYGYDQGQNGYGYQQPQVSQQQYYGTASPTTPPASTSRQTSASASIPRQQQQYVGTGHGPYQGARPSTAGSWRS